MEYLLKGMELGWALALLAGPILFTLLQATLAGGYRAGLQVGAGIWTSDLLFILATWKGASWLGSHLTTDQLVSVANWGGGTMLVLFGCGLLFHAPQPFVTPESDPYPAGSTPARWLQGFLVNTVNPFTILFWVGISGIPLVENDGTDDSAYYFYGGLLGTIVATDAFKVWMARQVRQWLQPVWLLRMRRLSGTLLLASGLFLLSRALGWVA
ncbi:MAG: hypothetical protein RLY31_2363 [Bacteroidota bacterium]|jgi:threonine/homoserine/homoserine lactone efflux protein